MSKKARAAVLVKPGLMEIREFDLPQPEKGAALCRVLSVGVCGTDKHSYRGETVQYKGTENEIDLPFPIIQGHEIAMEIVAIDEEAAQNLSFDGDYFGDWEGLTYDEIVAKWPDALENFFQHPDVLEIPHGESFPKLRERALACVEEIVARHPDQTVAVFAHGAILRTILTAALHMDLQYVWTIRQFNTAVNIVTYTEHGTTVELINGTGHLKYTQEPVD